MLPPQHSWARIPRSVILLLLLTCGCTVQQAEPLCVSTAVALPRSWRPSSAIREDLGTARWSLDEAVDTAYAVRTGLDELSDYFSNQPAAIRALRADAVEPFIDASYAASNMPGIQGRARDLARRTLMPLIGPYLERSPASATCREYSPLLTLAIYAHILLQTDDPRSLTMVALTNTAYRTCGSMANALGYDYRQKLRAKNVSTNDVWDLVMWSITFTDAQTIPGLEVPAEARDLPPTLWRFLAHYRLAGARAYRERARDETFYDSAYLATHIAYIVTGYGRHRIYMKDSPELYRFLRENFYAVLEIGELDLVAEFVDLFREYGCTEQNDFQLRHGTRYLLKLFHAAGDRWMAHRETYETEKVSDYYAVHKAWTGMAGVRARVPEPPMPGTYGGTVRHWLGDRP
jgi:hypothetical protein